MSTITTQPTIYLLPKPKRPLKFEDKEMEDFSNYFSYLDNKYKSPTHRKSKKVKLVLASKKR